MGIEGSKNPETGKLNPSNIDIGVGLGVEGHAIEQRTIIELWYDSRKKETKLNDELITRQIYSQPQIQNQDQESGGGRRRPTDNDGNGGFSRLSRGNRCGGSCFVSIGKESPTFL